MGKSEILMLKSRGFKYSIKVRFVQSKPRNRGDDWLLQGNPTRIEFALKSLVDDNFITLQVSVSTLESVKSSGFNIASFS